MSGYANISAFPTENELLAPSYLAINQQQQANLNRLAPYQVQEAQQKIGATGAEYMARAAWGLLDPAAYPDEASRAAAYPGVVAHLQSMGLAPNAPTQYPGAAALHQVAMMGTPSEKLAEFSANRAFGAAMSPPQTGVAPPGGGGPGYASAGAPAPGGAYGAGGPGANIQVPQEYMPFYQEASQRTGIPVDVLIAQHRQESGFNPNATGSAGEIGIGQIAPATARSPGYGMQPVDPATLRDPRTNINFAADYLRARLPPGTDPRDPVAIRRALVNYNGGGDPNYVANVTRYLPASAGQAVAAGAGGGQQQPAGRQPVILGDSYASRQGLGGDGVVGAQPAKGDGNVLDQVKTQAQSGKLRGQDVVISTGTVNAGGDTSRVQEQIQAAQDGGANSVTIVGAVDTPQFAATNARLQQIAQFNGARFVPAGPAGADGAHPASYAPLRQAVRLGGTAAAGPAALPPPASTAPPAGAPASGTTTAEGELGLPVLSAPRNAILPAAPPPPPAGAQAQPAAAPQQQSQIVGPPPPALPPLNANQLNAQQQQTVDAMAQSARFTPPQLVQQIEAFRQNNIALQQKAYGDWIQAQQLAVSQGQLTVAQANSNLERLKADPNYQGMVKRAQETNSNIEVRGVGNLVMNPDGSRTLVPQPYPTDVVGAGGAKMPGFAYPGLGGGPATFSPTVTSTGQPITSSLSPEAEAESKAYGQQSQEIIAAGASAPVSMQRLDILQNAAESFRTGSSAAMRLAGGKAAVDALQTLGITPPAWLANGAAAGETIGKEGGYLAAQMTRVLGSHEAASVFSAIKTLQPNIEMSSGGFPVIVSSIRQGLQRDQDIATYREHWLADPKNNGSIRGMMDAFEKTAPIEAYASRVVPYPMPKTKDAAIPNVIYNTGQGPMLWNGTAFEALPTR
jgi:soluble lytic murein transglycosylase-like protein